MTDSTDVALARPSLAWLDNTSDAITTEQELRQIDSRLEHFKTIDEWKTDIANKPSDARIVLVVTGAFGEQIAANFDQYPQIIAVYVYCMNKAKHQQWSSTIPKVKGVIVDFLDLKNRLRADFFPAPDPSGDESSATSSGSAHSYFDLDTQYYLSHVYISHVLQIPPAPNEKDNFISTLQHSLQGNNNASAVIREFQENYSAERVLSWLRRDAIFQRFLRHAFAQADARLLLECRFLIRDIKTQLEQHPCASKVEAFYGQVIDSSTLEYFKSSVGKLITFKSFLATTTNRAEALTCCIHDSTDSEREKPLLLIIEADPKTQGAPPFTQTGSVSTDEDPNEVLFMIGSLFRIIRIEQGENSVTNIHLSLCSEDDDNSSVKLTFDQLKNRNTPSDLIEYNALLCRIGRSINDQKLVTDGEAFLSEYAQGLPKEDPKVLRCYETLSAINHSLGDLDAVVDYLQKTIDFHKQISKMSDLSLVENYKGLGTIYSQKKDYTQALATFEKLLQILKSSEGDHHLNILFCLVNMASVHEAEDTEAEAMSFYYQALAIMALHPSIDPNMYAAVHNNLGTMNTCEGNYELALGFYKTALAAKIKLFTEKHSSVANTYESIGFVYSKMNDITRARENLEKADAIYQAAQGPGNSSSAAVQELIESLSPPSEPSV